MISLMAFLVSKNAYLSEYQSKWIPLKFELST